MKATPVVFITEPQPTTQDEVALLWRKELEVAEVPGKVLARLLKRFRPFPAFLRDVLLADGYVYARTPLLAATLSDGVSLAMLFREERLVIERGSQRLVAARDEDGGYVYADGPEMGKTARLFLFDRVSVEGATLAEPRHLDVGEPRCKARHGTVRDRASGGLGGIGNAALRKARRSGDPQPHRGVARARV